MKVLHINKSDTVGGAAIAAYRLHEGLLAKGVDSRLLVGKAKTQSDRVDTIAKERGLGRQLYRFTYQAGLNEINFLNTFKIPNRADYQSADVLNFHNLHSGYFNYLAIPQLTRQKPTFFTLHDMWSFTGHCVYSFECDRWKTGCGQCPYLHTYPPVVRDNTHIAWKLKQWTYRRSHLQVITLSHWLTEQAKQSMLGRFPIHHVPNGIDTQAYRPIDPTFCRQELGISPHKQVLMCAAESLEDGRKGIDLLSAALQKLPAELKSKMVLVTLGKGGEDLSSLVGIEVMPLGYVSDDRCKSVAYSSADLFLFPSRADNLPLVLQESMACGTPMVAFNVGGVPDLVRPGVTGYLAEPQDIEDFCRGIVTLMSDADLLKKLRRSCRDIVLAEYSIERQVERYLALYQQVKAAEEG